MSARVLAPLRSVVRLPARGRVGVVLLLLVLAVIALGPAFAPHGATETVGPPGAPPGGSFALGTDALGRDVLSGVLDGGRSVLLLGLATMALSYVFGAAIGMLAGFRPGGVDTLLMRTMDLVLSFPGMLVILLAIAGLGSGVPILVGAVALITLPSIARLVRTATSEAAQRGYVEAAIARGEGTGAILAREILPNILDTLVADAGLRFAYVLVTIASVNFLGLGLAAGSPDWGLMVAANRQLIDINPMAVLAPSLMLALLAISVNLAGDALAASAGRRSGGAR